MKKSKVIVPAMALLLFSTAASVTSTVAWFTSTRTFTTTVGQFNVVETDGNLECVMEGDEGRGGTETINNGKAVKVISEVKNSVHIDPKLPAGTGEGQLDNPANIKATVNPVVLTHGSVNHATGNAYIINPDNTAAFLEKANNASWAYKEGVTIKDSTTPDPVEKTVDVYVAVKWTMTFTYHFAADTKPVGVYLDLDGSSFNDQVTPTLNFTKSASGDYAELNSSKGFRIAFMNRDNNQGELAKNNFAWGNNVPLTDEEMANIDVYSTSAGYSQGDEVWYDADGNGANPGAYYMAKDDIAAEAGAWDAAKWKPTGKTTLDKTGDKAANLSYVAGTSTVTSYTADNNYFNHIDNDTPVAEGAETSTALGKKTRVCVLTEAHPTITINCAAWFEGTDPNIVSGTALECLEATMKFYARSLSA